MLAKGARRGRATKRKGGGKAPQRGARRGHGVPAAEEDPLEEQKFTYQKTFNLKDEAP